MRKFKILSMILIALASSVIFVACSCAPRRNVSPKEIVISQTSSEIYVGETVTIGVSVIPENATDVTVTVSSNHEGVAKIDKTTISGVSGEVVVTGVADGTTNIEFVIRHTSVTKKTHTITVIQPVDLDAPKSVEFNEITNNLEFGAVENAENYELEITNTETNEVVVAEVEHQLTQQGMVLINLLNNNLITPQTKYDIKVRALGYGKIYRTGEYSEALSLLKLQTPQNIRYENGEIVWDTNSLDNVEYKYIFNGNTEIPATPENRIAILKIEPNEPHSVQIKTISSDNGVYASDFSEVFSVYQLSQTTGKLNNLNKLAGKITNSVFEFEAVEGAVSYSVLVLNELKEKEIEKTILRSEPLEIEITNSLENGKNYTIQITAIGNSSNIIDSEVYEFKFTKHHAPTNFAIENGKLLFEHNTQSAGTKYEIVVVMDSQLKQEQVFEITAHHLQLSDVLADEGSYEIYIRAISTTTPNFANSNQVNTELVYNKLAKPKTNKILNNSVIEFTEIDNAVNYHFYINGKRENNITYELQGNGFGLANISTITKNLQADIEHSIEIVALNQGQTTSKINEAGEKFVFRKLQTPSQNYRIEKDTILWDAVAGTDNYNVWENQSDTFINVRVASHTMQNILQGNNQIKVVAVGNNQNLINSEPHIFRVAGQQLPAPSNIKVENGEFGFNFSAEANYEVFMETEEGNLEKVVTLTDGNFNIANYLTPNKDVLVGLRAVPKENIGKLGSAMVKITLHKLAVPVNIEVGRWQDNYNDYYLSYSNNLNASNYQITVTHAIEQNNFSQTVGANSIKISDVLSTKQSGVYSITVVAVGDLNKQLTNENSVGYLTSQVSQTYQVVKLNAPENIVLQDGIITFSAQPNANNISEFGYIVKLTTAEDVLIDEIFTETNSLDITDINVPSNIKVYVKAVGNEIGSVNSDYSEMSDEITTLNKVENVRVEQGKIVWNKQEQSQREVLYDVYLQAFEEVEIIRVANNLAQTEFELEQDLTLNNHHKIFVVAKSIGYFNSPLSDELLVVKLPTVENFEISYTPENHQLVWDLLLDENRNEIASGYQVIEVVDNTEIVVGVVEAGVNQLAFNNLNVNQPGTHNLKIRAIGGVVGSENYITSNYSDTLSVVVLAPVANLKTTEGVLSWQHSFESEFDKPINYYLTISQQDTEFEEFTLNTDQTSFPFPQRLPEGQYIVKILSVGEHNKITSAPATRTVIKAHTNNLNLRSVSGVITWESYGKPNTTYEIYLAEDDFENENSYQFVGSTTHNSFVFSDDLLQEDVLYQIKLKVVPSAEVASGLSQGLQVVKLPQVQSFAINKGQNNNPHYFSWEQISVLLADYQTAVSGYRITPQFETDWNEGFVANTETELPFSFPVAGEYQFAIKAIGNTALAEQNEIAFLNSNISQVLTLVVLDLVESVVIENGNLVINHSDLYSNLQTQPQSFLVTVKGETPEGEEQPYYREFNLFFAESGQTIWTFRDEHNELLPSGAYTVTVVAVSQENNIINSDQYVLENVVVLKAPSNLNLQNGKFGLQDSETQSFEVYYEFLLNNTSAGQFLLNDIENVKDLLDTQTKTLSVRAVAEGAIYSDYSETVNITKLPTVVGVNIENIDGDAMLYWTNTISADGNYAENKYRIYFNPLSDEMISALSEHGQFNEEGKYLEVIISGEVGYTLPTNLPSGNYSLHILAVGGEIEDAEVKTIYLNSNQSAVQNFNVVGKIENLTVSKGIAKWSATPHAQEYLVEIFKGHNLEEVSELELSVVTKFLQTDLNQFNLPAGNYTAKITALGNQKQNITGGEHELVLFSKGQPLNSFRVIDGYLTWTITEELIKHYATGNPEFSGNLSEEDFELIANIIVNNKAGVNKSLANNLHPLANPVFAIKKQGQTTFVNHTLSVHSAQVENRTITLQYNFNLPEGRYDVVAMLQGNELLTEVENDGEVLSILSTNPELENAVTNVLHINSAKTENMPVFKLPAPITPQPGATHSIENNLLTFNLISVNNQTWLNYMIIAKDHDPAYSDVVYKVNPNTIKATSSTHSIDVRKITGLTAGTLYDLVVIAMGTENSASNSYDVNHLTSNYTTQSEVVILQAPLELNTLEGKVAFRTVTSANNYILRIWNDSELFEDSLPHQPSENRVKIELNVNEVINDPNNDHHKYLSEKDGVYFYDLENNPQVPNNFIKPEIHRQNKAYYVSVHSLGDGTRTINSQERQTDVIKFNSVDLAEENPIIISDGKFMWSHVVAYHFDREGIEGAQYRPDQYKVIIVRESDTTEKEQSVPILVNASDIVSEGFALYELPDSAYFEVQDEEGNIRTINKTLSSADEFNNEFSYRIIVSAYGDKSAGSHLHFATSNSRESVAGTRLRTPKNITTINGIVEWDYVPFTSHFGFEFVVGDTSIIRNVGNHITFDLSDPEFNAGVFMFSVKAFGGGNSGFLNSLRSEQVKMLKLPTPQLRIENGEIKWNNEESNLSQNYTVLRIKGPNGFDIHALEVMQDIIKIEELQDGVYEVVVENHNIINTLHELSLKQGPVGVYEIQVQYIGSTGVITQPNDEFFTTNSNIINIKTTKLNSPVKNGKEGRAGIDVQSSDEGENTYTYVEWSAVENATNYNVVAIKFAENAQPTTNQEGYLEYDKNSVINKVVFSLKDPAHARHFSVENGEYKFNLQAIVEHDNTQSGIRFGDDYYVYVEAFADDANAEVGNTVSGYSLSSDSNLEPVKVPLTPENLKILDTGLITWDIRTPGSTSVLRISYIQNGNEQEYEVRLDGGESSYQLELINPSYSVQIRSEAGGQSSNYSDVATGSFMLYASGEGTEQNPYIILNADQLYNINHHTSKHFVLGADIDLTVSDNPTRPEWRPIGEAHGNINSSEFSGVLDGGGFSVSNIVFSNRITRRLGFINTISNSGIVKNLTLNIIGNNINIELFGGVAVANYGLITDVVVKGDIYSLQSNTFSGIHQLGGVVAQNYGIITQTTNELNITSQTNSTNTVYIGGIAYQNMEDANIRRSSNKGHLSGAGIGGIVYENLSAVDNVFNTGQITVTITNNYNLDIIYVGGLIGTNETGATLAYGYVWLDGKVSLTNNKATATIYAGGLVGANNQGAGKVEYSYSVFAVSRAGNTQNIYAGGIAGRGNSNNYQNVYFRETGNMQAVPTESVPVNLANSVRNESFMKNEGFVNNEHLGSNFKLNPGGYPLLHWQ